MHRYLKLILWIFVYLVVAFGIGQISQGSIDSWYAGLNKPSFNPPNYIFPIMWSILYVFIATAGWKLWDVSAPKHLKITYIIYTLFNWAWTPIFFGAQQITLGLIWIIAINIITIYFIIKAWKLIRLSGALMIPVLGWTLFAMVLSYNIWVLNT